MNRRSQKSKGKAGNGRARRETADRGQFLKTKSHKYRRQKSLAECLPHADYCEAAWSAKHRGRATPFTAFTRGANPNV
jgi:hypothetical protein